VENIAEVSRDMTTQVDAFPTKSGNLNEDSEEKTA
jgi:hypothetical protein